MYRAATTAQKGSNMNKRCIGEKIFSFAKFFIVALPNSNDEYIKVSSIPVSAYDAIFYYDDNTVEEFHYMDFIKKYTSPEWAAKLIPGYRPEMKLTLAEAFCSVLVHGMFDDQKANEKLRGKLEQMTQYEFYNKKW